MVSLGAPRRCASIAPAPAATATELIKLWLKNLNQCLEGKAPPARYGPLRGGWPCNFLAVFAGARPRHPYTSFGQLYRGALYFYGAQGPFARPICRKQPKAAPRRASKGHCGAAGRSICTPSSPARGPDTPLRVLANYTVLLDIFFGADHQSNQSCY